MSNSFFSIFPEFEAYLTLILKRKFLIKKRFYLKMSKSAP